MALPAQSDASPYDGLAERYDRARPSYPNESIAHLQAGEGEVVADVGAGTGIFTRQLAATLNKAKVVGVEASEDMHREAQRSSAGVENLSFLKGRAEALPFADHTLRIITVATAIHWFDRPAFYEEALRCLRRSGELVVLQNIRRWWDNAFLAGYEQLHESAVDGYLRGRFPAPQGRYYELDVSRELRERSDFADVRIDDVLWSCWMSSDEFVDFSLTSSITQRAITAMGEQAYLGSLRQLLQQHASGAEVVEVPYLTRTTTATAFTPDGR